MNGTFFEKASEVPPHFTSRRVSITGTFRDGFQYDRFQFNGNGPIELLRRRRFFVKNLMQQRGTILAREDRPQGQQFIQGGSERIDIRPVVDWNSSSCCLFGAHVT